MLNTSLGLEMRWSACFCDLIFHCSSFLPSLFLYRLPLQGKITLDRVFEERELLNQSIVTSVNHAAQPWGVEVLRFEIRDINPPPSLRNAMDLQAEAERRKRAEILESEGRRQSAINLAEGQRASAVRTATGEAEATLARAKAAAEALSMIASAVQRPGGKEAMTLRVAEQYLDGFSKIAKQSTTMLLPANASDPAAMVTQAMATWQTIAAKTGAGNASPSSSGGDHHGLPSYDDLIGSSDSSSGSKALSAVSDGLSSALTNATGSSSSGSKDESFKPKPY
jgi:C-terminal region of band_7/SPFH domain / Band 7 family